MAQEEKFELHFKVVGIVDSLLATGNLRTELNAYSNLPKFASVRDFGYLSDFKWGKAQMTIIGMEIYALKADYPLIESNRSICVDSIFSRMFRGDVTSTPVFFDTLGDQGRARIHFDFFISTLFAYTTLRTLIYRISRYKEKRCIQVLNFCGDQGTPPDSYRTLVVDTYKPLQFYLISNHPKYIPALGQNFKTIGRYEGDMQFLRGVIYNNRIVDMGFLCRVDESEIRVNYQ